MVLEDMSHPAHCMQHSMEVCLCVREVRIEWLKDLQELLISRGYDLDQHEAQSLITHVESAFTDCSGMARLEPGNQGVDLFMFTSSEVHELIQCREPSLFCHWCDSLLQSVKQ